MRDRCDRITCLNEAKVNPENVGHALCLNLTLDSVHTAARGVAFYISAGHSEKDINDTINAFGTSINTMIDEGIIK